MNPDLGPACAFQHELEPTRRNISRDEKQRCDEEPEARGRRKPQRRTVAAGWQTEKGGTRIGFPGRAKKAGDGRAVAANLRNAREVVGRSVARGFGEGFAAQKAAT